MSSPGPKSVLFFAGALLSRLRAVPPRSVPTVAETGARVRRARVGPPSVPAARRREPVGGSTVALVA